VKRTLIVRFTDWVSVVLDEYCPVARKEQTVQVTPARFGGTFATFGHAGDAAASRS